MVSDVPAHEVLARLAPEERAWVEEFRDRVRAEFGARVRDIRIFGSKVRGDFHDESDIDLLVLIDDGDRGSFDRIGAIAHSINSWLQVHTFDFDAYHAPKSRASGFYRELRKESVKL